MNSLQINLTWDNNTLVVTDTSYNDLPDAVKNDFTVVEYLIYGDGSVYAQTHSPVVCDRKSTFTVDKSGKYSYYCMYLPSKEFLSNQVNPGELY